MIRIHPRAATLVAAGVLLGALPARVSSQDADAPTGTLAGAVFDSTSGAPMIQATVHVLGTTFFGETDLFGKYEIRNLPVGDYGITFSHARADQLEYLPPAFIVSIRGGETTELEMFIPSLPSILTASCAWIKDGRGAMTGYVRERYRRTPLPQSRVKASWPATGDVPGGEASSVTDIDGVYRLCELPSNVPITLEADFLGLTVRTSGLIVGPDESRRRDFDIDAIGVDKKKVELDRQARERLTDGETDIQGRLIDFETSDGVEGALLQIRNHDEMAISDGGGHFTFHDVRAGVRVLDIQHLAYGEQTSEILLTRGGATDLQVQVQKEAVSLEPLIVTARKQTRLDTRLVTLGTRKDVMIRDQIDQIAKTSVDVGDLLRRFPGVQVRNVDVGGERLLCVNRGRGGRDRSGLRSAMEISGRTPGCDTLPVFVDGQPVFNPERMLATIAPINIESIELVTMTEAAAYPGAQNGAIVIYTRGNGPWANRRR